MTWPPVRMAMSPSMALRRSPKPGALTARDLKVPRILFTTRVARASPSTSSAMMASGLPDCMTFSSSGSRSLTERSEEHTSELQSRQYLVCRLLLEKKKLLKAADHLVQSHV